MLFTIPAAPSAWCWRAILTSLDGMADRGPLLGHPLEVGTVVDVPAGALLLDVEAVTTGWWIVVHLVTEDADGPLRQLCRQHGEAGDALDAVRATFAELLAAYPVSEELLAAVAEAEAMEGECGICREPGARTVRGDSSGITGLVCDDCDGEATFALSFT